jgi:hypothetical protein
VTRATSEPKAARIVRAAVISAQISSLGCGTDGRETLMAASNLTLRIGERETFLRTWRPCRERQDGGSQNTAVRPDHQTR